MSTDAVLQLNINDFQMLILIFNSVWNCFVDYIFTSLNVIQLVADVLATLQMFVVA